MANFWSTIKNGIGGIAKGAIGALGSGLLGGALSLGSSIFSQNRDLKGSKSLMDYQNSLNFYNWERQNAYNHPSSQLQRLKESGLNPNLVYGSGGVSNTSESIPSVSQGRSSFRNPIESIAQFQSIRNMSSQADLAESQARLNDARAKKVDQEYDQSGQMFPKLMDIKDWSLTKLKFEAKTLDYKLNHILPSDRSLKLSKINEIQSRIELMAEQKGLTKEQARYYSSMRLYVAAKEALTRSQKLFSDYTRLKILPYRSSLAESQASLWRLPDYLNSQYAYLISQIYANDNQTVVSDGSSSLSVGPFKFGIDTRKRTNRNHNSFDYVPRY